MFRPKKASNSALSTRSSPPAKRWRRPRAGPRRLAKTRRCRSAPPSSRSRKAFRPRGLRGIAGALQRQLPRHQVERIDADAELEGVVALDLRRDLVAQKIRDHLDQFAGYRFVLHVISPVGLATATNRFRSPTSV